MTYRYKFRNDIDKPAYVEIISAVIVRFRVFDAVFVVLVELSRRLLFLLHIFVAIQLNKNFRNSVISFFSFKLKTRIHQPLPFGREPPICLWLKMLFPCRLNHIKSRRSRLSSPNSSKQAAVPMKNKNNCIIWKFVISSLLRVRLWMTNLNFIQTEISLLVHILIKKYFQPSKMKALFLFTFCCRMYDSWIYVIYTVP